MVILLLLTIIGIFISACFSGFENGMLRVRRARLKRAVDQGSRTAERMAFFLERPALMLGTILLGNNLANCFTAIFFDEWVQRVFATQSARDPLLTSIVASAVLTLVILIFGEVTPKVWFRQHPFYRCQRFVYPIFAFYRATAHIVNGLSTFSFWLERRFAPTMVSSGSSAHAREDFRLTLLESEEAGTISTDARRLLDDALEFHNHRVSDIMTPRERVRTIPATMDLASAVAFAAEHDVSRLPVRDNETGQWLAIFSVYDAIFSVNDKRWPHEQVLDHVRPLTTINATAPIDRVLPLARNNDSPLMAVVDDHGHSIGIVTTENVVDPLFRDVSL